MKTYRYLLYPALLLAALAVYFPLCTQDTAKLTLQSEEKKEVWLVYFVHGIMSIKPHLTIDNFLRFMRDDVEDTTYSRTIEIMRQDPIFYKNQAMLGFGCTKIDQTRIEQGYASGALATILDQVTAFSHGPHIENHYYTYGWSGLMSPTRRFKDAIELYKGIEIERAKFIAQGITPKIRVIGYSHGGNVVLNLGAVRQRAAVDKNMIIDEAILLGTPVQSETDYLINDPLFKRVYHIYSSADRVQKLDFFSYERFFSRRTFKERRDFILPEKLIQIQIKMTRNNKGVGMRRKKFKNSFNFDNASVVSGKSPLLRDSSPGHAELWFFGWTPVHYRDTFALNPLPTVSILPYILSSIDAIKVPLSPKHPVIVDIRPEHGIILIKNVTKRRFYKVIEFLPRDVFKELQRSALTYKPENYNVELYEECIQKAVLQARQESKARAEILAQQAKVPTLKKKRKKSIPVNQVS